MSPLPEETAGNEQAAAADTKAAAGRPLALTYVPQFDGLRWWFGALPVLLGHSVLREGAWSFLGKFGVHNFMVLSGFLITSLLMADRQRARERGMTRMAAFRRFYIRRSLRIFPLFYVVLAITCLLPGSGMFERVTFAEPHGVIQHVSNALGLSTWHWHAAYLSNLWYAAGGTLGWLHPGWTLAVEEQFYLVWPLAVLLLPRRWQIGALAVVTILLSLAWRIENTADGLPYRVVRYHTIAYAELFAVGACLGLWQRRWIPPDGAGRQRVQVLLLASAALVVGTLGIVLWEAPPIADRLTPPWTLRHGVVLSASALFGAGLVVLARLDLGGPWRALMAHRTSRYLGRISYGIYLIHSPMWHAAGWIPETGSVPVPVAALAIAGVVAAASVSWYGFEGPLNRLKARIAP